MTELILTSHSGLNFGPKESIFFNSLRKYYIGDVFVFTNNQPDNLFIEKSKQYNYHIVPYPCIIHYCVDRFFYWERFLKETEYKPNKIFMIDLVDTFWQKNPFDFHGNLEFSMESIQLKDCPINKDWLVQLLGKNMGENFIEKLKNDYVSCAGAIRGKYDHILEYLKFMTDRLKGVTSNLDQAVHNCYYHALVDKESFESDELCTVGYQKNFEFDSFGNLLKRGNVVTCVHQYIHHEVLNLIAKKYE